MVWGIRIQLGLHCECHAVAGEELEAGLVAEYFKQPSGGRRVNVSYKVQFACLGMVQAEVLVIAADHSFRDDLGGGAGCRTTCGSRNLALAEQHGLAEIECGATHRKDLACRDEGVVHLGDGIRIDAENVVKDVLCGESVQVEIYVVGQVANRGLVRGGLVVY